MLLSPTREKDPESPPLPKELEPSDLKLQETFSLELISVIIFGFI